jgi:hypothetical protein
LEITQGLSWNDKMPGPSWGISAWNCQTGAKLADVPNSVCGVCYAMRNRFAQDVVQSALERRLEAMHDPRWHEAMVFLVNRYCRDGHMRWFDSGDVQSPAMVHKIFDVAEATPRTSHWLPSREYGHAADALASRRRPRNLAYRLSAHIIDGEPPTAIARRLGLLTSSVKTVGFTCPASRQDNHCGSCRACWDQRITNVSYHKH